VWLQHDHKSRRVFSKLLGESEELQEWIRYYEHKQSNKVHTVQRRLGSMRVGATNSHSTDTGQHAQHAQHAQHEFSSLASAAVAARSGKAIGHAQLRAAPKLLAYMRDHVPFSQAPPIHVSNTLCFEEIYRRKTTRGFFYGVPAELVHKFKETAYRNANIQFALDTSMGSGSAATGSRGALPSGLLNSRKLKITIPTRGKGHYREMVDPSILQKYLEFQLGNMVTSTGAAVEVTVTLFDTSNLTQKIQVQTAATTDVLICTHGAFEANVVYMRPQTLLVEMRGMCESACACVCMSCF